MNFFILVPDEEYSSACISLFHCHSPSAFVWNWQDNSVRVEKLWKGFTNFFEQMFRRPCLRVLWLKRCWFEPAHRRDLQCCFFSFSPNALFLLLHSAPRFPPFRTCSGGSLTSLTLLSVPCTGVCQKSFAKFTVDAAPIDRMGERPVQAVLVNPRGQRLPCQVDNKRDGTYACSYSPPDTGKPHELLKTSR